MNKVNPDFEYWVWTELLAFDNTHADLGVAEYFDTLGFVPQTLCLLFSGPDFILQHEGISHETVLSPLVCSRHAHPGNEKRVRQQWTNWQLRHLITELSQSGCTTYLSCFTSYFGNCYGREWISDHPETRQVWNYHGRGHNLNVLQQLNNGTLVEDYVIPKTVLCCIDYGFAGWHGPDGWGPLSSGNITGTDFSDGIMRQFLSGRDWNLPECLTMPCENILCQEELDFATRFAASPAARQLQARSTWILESHRAEWIEFNVTRWCQFWGKMTNALHAKGLKNAINSSWTKANFDALYEYGIDYRRMASLGIDAMVVETLALSLFAEAPEFVRYYDFPVGLAEIKAFAPEFKLIFLHGIKDVVEDWDNLRHTPPGYEAETYKVANIFYHDGTSLRRSADGLLACLADGITSDEWSYIRKLWQVACEVPIINAGEVTLLWADEVVDRGIADFTHDAFLPGHDQVTQLAGHGVGIQVAARLENASHVSGAVLLPSAHLVVPERIEALLTAHPAPVILCGRLTALERFGGKIITDGRMAVVIAKGGSGKHYELTPPSIPYKPTFGDLYFLRDRARQAVLPQLWQLAFERIRAAVAADRLKKGHLDVWLIPGQENCTLMTRQLSLDTWDITIENRCLTGRATRRVGFSLPVEYIKIISDFPLRPTQSLDKLSLSLALPPGGIASARIKIITP